MKKTTITRIIFFLYSIIRLCGCSVVCFFLFNAYCVFAKGLIRLFAKRTNLSFGRFVFCFLVGGLPVSSFSQILDSAGSLKSGIAQFNEGNFEGAQVELNKAVELNPKNSDAFFYLAEVSFVLNESKKAMENYNKAITLNSKNPRAYKGRGKVKAKLEDFYGSVEDFTKAIELDKNYADAFFNRALSYLNLKDYKSAIADFSKVIEINPKDYQAFAQRGSAKFQNGDKKNACSDWSKAGELGYFKIYDTIKKNCK